MQALRAFSDVHSPAKQSWSFRISFPACRAKKEKKRWQPGDVEIMVRDLRPWRCTEIRGVRRDGLRKNKDLVATMVASSYNRAQPGGGFYLLISRAAEIWIFLYTNVLKLRYGMM